LIADFADGPRDDSKSARQHMARATLLWLIQQVGAQVGAQVDALWSKTGQSTDAQMRSDLQRIGAAASRLYELVSRSAGEPEAPPQDGDAEPPSAALSLGAEEHSPRLEAPASRPEVDHARLLIVDDNEPNRDALARSLERLGYDIVCAEDGRQGLDVLESTNVDLLLLDVVMPGLDGYDVLARCKADVRLREIPVLMISALDDLDSVVRCIELGAEDYLAKPFDPVLLRARIGASLEKKRLRDQELAYLDQVAQVTAAAAAVEAQAFDPEGLRQVAERADALGQLARVFRRMALEVSAREERMRQEISALRIQIDPAREDRAVAEITESEFFQDLREQVRRLRAQATPP
jgi:DNA-binding response OmpR family regulator